MTDNNTSEDRGQQHCRRQLSATRRKKTKTNPKNQSYKHREKHGRGGRARERWREGVSGSAEPTSERWGVVEAGLGGGRRGRGSRER